MTDGEATEGQVWHPGRTWLPAAGATWAGCGWADSWDRALAGGSLLVGDAMSQEASRIAEAVAGVDFGEWRGGAARTAAERLEEVRVHAGLAHAHLWRAEEAMRRQSSTVQALLFASVGVP